ncbi:putative transcription factor TDA9 [Fusarium bulbicola]|nr:putative transcription factor TDA9 [Fusarium bulbicola]
MPENIASNSSMTRPRGRQRKCTYCERIFTKEEHLKRHERSHTGEKPFECYECGKSYARRSSDVLYRHSQTHSSTNIRVQSENRRKRPSSGVTPISHDNKTYRDSGYVAFSISERQMNASIDPAASGAQDHNSTASPRNTLFTPSSMLPSPLTGFHREYMPQPEKRQRFSPQLRDVVDNNQGNPIATSPCAISETLPLQLEIDLALTFNGTEIDQLGFPDGYGDLDMPSLQTAQSPVFDDLQFNFSYMGSPILNSFSFPFARPINEATSSSEKSRSGRLMAISANQMQRLHRIWSRQRPKILTHANNSLWSEMIKHDADKILNTTQQGATSRGYQLPGCNVDQTFRGRLVRYCKYLDDSFGSPGTASDEISVPSMDLLDSSLDFYFHSTPGILATLATTPIIAYLALGFRDEIDVHQSSTLCAHMLRAADGQGLFINDGDDDLILKIRQGAQSSDDLWKAWARAESVKRYNLICCLLYFDMAYARLTNMSGVIAINKVEIYLPCDDALFEDATTATAFLRLVQQGSCIAMPRMTVRSLRVSPTAKLNQNSTQILLRSLYLGLVAAKARVQDQLERNESSQSINFVEGHSMDEDFKAIIDDVVLLPQTHASFLGERRQNNALGWHYLCILLTTDVDLLETACGRDGLVRASNGRSQVVLAGRYCMQRRYSASWIRASSANHISPDRIYCTDHGFNGPVFELLRDIDWTTVKDEGLGRVTRYLPLVAEGETVKSAPVIHFINNGGSVSFAGEAQGLGGVAAKKIARKFAHLMDGFGKWDTLVLGATGTQGGSIANLLVRYPDQYLVRCLTRSPSSDKAKALTAKGAQLVKADLTVPSTLPEAFEGVWGVFAVTDFYDTAVLDDPMSEEKQGQHIVEASVAAGVECFLWSTLPSSREISGGKFVTRLYEGKQSVDAVIRDAGLKGAFIGTGNFYENMISRKYAAYDRENDVITMTRPIIGPDAEREPSYHFCQIFMLTNGNAVTSLYVEKDLGAVAKALFDQWDEKKDILDGKYFLASGARETMGDINAILDKVSGKKAIYKVKPTCGIPDRDIMLQLYNNVGMYPGVDIPTPDVFILGVKLHGAEDFIRERLLPHLGLDATIVLKSKSRPVFNLTGFSNSLES